MGYTIALVVVNGGVFASIATLIPDVVDSSSHTLMAAAQPQPHPRPSVPLLHPSASCNAAALLNITVKVNIFVWCATTSLFVVLLASLKSCP